MPTVVNTKPDLDQALPVAVAARIAGMDRTVLAELIDQRLIHGTDIDTVRSLGSCGTLRLSKSEDDSPIVLRLDTTGTPTGDLTDDELLDLISGPHRVSPHAAGRGLLVTVRGFVIAHGTITAVSDGEEISKDRRGRPIIGRRLTVDLRGRIKDLAARPSKAKGADRFLGRRAVTTPGGSLVELAAS